MKQILSSPLRFQMLNCQLIYRCPRGRSPSSLSDSEKCWILLCGISQLESTEINLDVPITIWLCSGIPNACEEEQIFADRYVVKFVQELLSAGLIPKRENLSELLKLLRSNPAPRSMWLVTPSKSGLSTMTRGLRVDYLSSLECRSAQQLGSSQCTTSHQP